jgi:hypothetical protein
MVASRFNVERTPAGQQFVIPGTEKPVLAPRRKYAKDGSQLVIPGAEQLSPKMLAARLINRPLRPRVGQRSLLGTTLFGGHPPK